MTIRGFTGSPAGGGLSTPHIEPRPHLPAEYEFAPFHPYQMAHLVIGWPLLLPGALGGTYTQVAKRERRRDTLTVVFSAESSLAAMVVEAMSSTQLTLTAGICAEQAEAYQGGMGSVELDGEVGVEVSGIRLAWDIGNMFGELEISVIDQVRLNQLWRLVSDMDDPDLAPESGELRQAIKEDRLIRDRYQGVR